MSPLNIILLLTNKKATKEKLFILSLGVRCIKLHVFNNYLVILFYIFLYQKGYS
jgi:hypothetical protein